MQIRQIVTNEAAQQPHQLANLGGRARPVLGAEGKNRQETDSEVAGGTHGAPQRFDATAMAFPTRQAARRRPAAVAVHDDGNVPRHGEIADLSVQRHVLRHPLQPHTVRISFSLFVNVLSTSAIASSVAFCTCSDDRFPSSPLIFSSFSRLLPTSSPSSRTFLTSTPSPSAYLFAPLTI